MLAVVGAENSCGVFSAIASKAGAKFHDSTPSGVRACFLED